MSCLRAIGHMAGLCVLAMLATGLVALIPGGTSSRAAAGPATARPYRTLADVPRGAWFRDTRRDDAAPIRGRVWQQIIAVRKGTGSTWCQDVVVFADGTSATAAELSATYVFTRDPFPPAPVEWPCLVGAEKSEEL